MAPGAYTYKGWTLVVATSGRCTIVGAIQTAFATLDLAVSWIDGQPR